MRYRSFLLIVLICIFYSYAAMAAGRKRNGTTSVITFKGNEFTMFTPYPDTIYMVNPKTGKQEAKVTRIDPYPVKINNKPIHSNVAQDMVFSKYEDFIHNNEQKFDEYVAENIQRTFDKYEDGVYNIFLANIVVSYRGKITYYEFPDMSVGETHTPLDKQKRELLENVLNSIIDVAPPQEVLKGKDGWEPYMMSCNMRIKVKGHKATIEF